MTSLLCKIFIKDRENIKDPNVRRAYGTMVSIIGIAVNIGLAIIKLIAVLLSGSISITADALNNLSDAGSQVISLISFKISSKPADRDHPFGHARIEYVASMIVSFIVLLIGFELLKDSIGKIINPSPVDFTTPTFIILSVSVLGKLWLTFFNKKIGKKINSSVMRATSADSLSDALATGAVLVSGIISYFTDFQTDAYMGVIVSVVIFIAGIKILNETKNSILGGAPDPEVLEGINSIIAKYPEIIGIHDMVVHSYGPGNIIASFHAEVDGSANIFETHDVVDNAEKEIWAALGIRATIHMDPIVTDDERVNAMRSQVTATVAEIDERISVHDFRFVEGKTHTNLIFDIAVPFELKMSDADIKREVCERISKIEPHYFCVITVDRA